MSSYRTNQWWVSPYNYEKEVIEHFDFAPTVKIHDVTLRDGEQMAGVIFDLNDKVAIAQELDSFGVDRIEAGNPVISESEKKSVKAVANLGLTSKVFCLSRSVKSDIDLALSCDVSGVLLYSPGSRLQIEKKLGWTTEKALEVPIEAASYAKSHGLYVAYTPYDTTRADLDTLRLIIEKMVDEGKVDSVAIFDTVGCATPQATSYLVRTIKGFCRVPLEVHCHNDFGLATANTLAAVAAGVEVVHTAFNGLGERCGNASTEEVAMGLKLLYGKDMGWKIQKITEICKLVEKRSKVALSISKPFVGINATRFEAGLVVDGIMKYPLTMEPILPELVGGKNIILLGKKSGRSSVIIRLKESGIDASDEQINGILQEVKREGEAKKRVLTDEEFNLIVNSFVKPKVG